ncbi:MAG: tetratricopeptide repeat protein [Cyanobacteria bacterium P01_F01_bin.150]
MFISLQYLHALLDDIAMVPIQDALTHLNEHLRQRQYKEALETIERMLQSPDQDTIEPTELSQVYFSLGEAYRGLSRFKEAIAPYQKAIDIAKCENQLPIQADSYNRLGLVYERLSEYGQAREALANAQNLALSIVKTEQESPNETKIRNAYVENNLGLVERQLRHYRLALSHYQNAYKSLEAIGQFENSANSKGILLNNIGIVATKLRIGKAEQNLLCFLPEELQSPEGSLEFFNQALTIYQNNSNPTYCNGKARTLHNRGFCNYLHHMPSPNNDVLNAVIDDFQMALKIRLDPAVLDRVGIARTLTNLGCFYGKHPEFINRYKLWRNKVQPLLDSVFENVEVSPSFSNPQCELAEGQIVALKILDCALALFEDMGDRNGQATVWRSYGHLFQGSQCFELSLQAFLKAYQIYKEIGIESTLIDHQDVLEEIISLLKEMPNPEQNMLADYEDSLNRIKDQIVAKFDSDIRADTHMYT